jgi:hypothetical protein
MLSVKPGNSAATSFHFIPRLIRSALSAACTMFLIVLTLIGMEDVKLNGLLISSANSIR